MARWRTLVAAALALLLPPALAWYKPAVGPHHYSVGRAAGLLSSFHRFPSTRRSESSALRLGTGRLSNLEMRPGVRSLSCQRQLNSRGTFQCKADVFLSLHEAECQSA
ncbi:neuropeptide B isoform X2 [Apodemus sylvaticus]|uniref:neuropeptide B isoform X2 n=1 Tax=Apodemus sylvaticus TaxID=10129 RepID=UPI0022425C44|nr:neuropeptide B isoform X2 [Apodemus sylvaticus]